MRKPVRATGVPWYIRQDYPRILGIMEDRDLLPPTYDQWRKRADIAKREIERLGGVAIEVTLDPETFSAWRAARGLHIDARARSLYVSEETYRHVRVTH